MTQQKSKASSRQTIEQKRGREAWEDIKSVKDIASDYRALARGLNAMIQVNGLGQTLGFLKAKGKDKDDKGKPRKNAHYALLEHLTHWMHHHFSTEIEDIREGKNDGLLEWVLKETTHSSDYRRATTECLAFGRWLSRFAEAELSDTTGMKAGAEKGAGND
jgi:CRISPR-associated protein Cmr5